MQSLSSRSRRIMRAFALLLLLALLATLLPLAVPPATAQIGNNQPAQPFASVVDCIRAGADLGQPSAAPRFATTCYASRLHDGGYTTSGGDPPNGDALPSDSALIEFGDAVPDGSGDLAGVATNGHV